jgi:hypothetical protein
MELEYEVAVAVGVAMERSRVVEITPIVADLRAKYPQLTQNEIAEIVIEAVSQKGGAILGRGQSR